MLMLQTINPVRILSQHVFYLTWVRTTVVASSVSSNHMEVRDMSIFKGFLGVAALAVTTPAMAASTHLTDVQFMQASRCAALIASPSLGKEDATSIDALLKSE